MSWSALEPWRTPLTAVALRLPLASGGPSLRSVPVQLLDVLTGDLLELKWMHRFLLRRIRYVEGTGKTGGSTLGAVLRSAHRGLIFRVSTWDRSKPCLEQLLCPLSCKIGTERAKNAVQSQPWCPLFVTGS
jgi:hypothetical protein